MADHNFVRQNFGAREDSEYVFITDFLLACRRVKNHSCQDIRIRPAVHSLNVFQFLSNVNFHRIPQ